MPFDELRARRAVNFFERVLRHTKGKFANQPFRLLEWQYNDLRTIFGTVDETGLRQYQTVYEEIPKKNGKSEFAAGIALFCLTQDNEAGAEVYSAAAAKDQASLVFNVAASMVDASPELRALLRVIRSTKKIVLRNDPDSFYRAIAADGDLQDGINPHCVIVDEFHRWKVAKAVALMDVLRRGMVARAQPLLYEITTAGLEEESPLCWREHEYARQIAAGIFQDPRFYGRIYAADPADDWTSPETWKKANPSLETNGGFLKLASLEKEVAKAINEPAEQAAFKRFHLNIWGQKENRWMDMEAWNACAGGERLARAKLKPEELAELWGLIDRVCFAGLDLSSNLDLTSLSLVFPRGDHIDIIPFFWIPKDNMRQREMKDKVPYSVWVEQGFIEATEGNVIDQKAIKRRLEWAREMFDLQEIGFDPWSATQLSLDLTDDGYKCVPIRQGFQSMSEPTKRLMELILAGGVRHAANPVLKWNADCMAVKSDGNDNIRPAKPDRQKSGKRIDGIVATIMGLSRAMLNMEPSSCPVAVI